MTTDSYENHGDQQRSEPDGPSGGRTTMEPFAVPEFDPAELPPGTTVLLLADSDRQRDVVRRALTGVEQCTDAALAATTDVRAAERFADAGVVDCSGDGRRSEPTTGRTGVCVQQVGVSVCHSLDELTDRTVRLAMYDIDSVLEAADVQTVYRFFHIVASAVARTGSLGVFGLDYDHVDAKCVTIYRRVFDHVADARGVPPGEPIPLSAGG